MMIETAISYSILMLVFCIVITSPLWILLLFGWLLDREQRKLEEAKKQ